MHIRAAVLVVFFALVAAIGAVAIMAVALDVVSVPTPREIVKVHYAKPPQSRVAER
jgi:hypothetical protein